MIAPPRHLLDVDDLSAAELTEVLDRAERTASSRCLEGLGAALVFEKPSIRTRNSMEMAVHQLGGHPVYLSASEVGLDVRETAEDVVRTLAGYHALVAARVFSHRTIERMAAVSPVPVVNLLSDAAHPMQALADLLTLRQRFGHLEGLVLAYVGDANNMLASLAVGAAMSGVAVRAACPAGYDPDEVLVDRVANLGGALVACERPEEAVTGADAVYTDVWASMGQEAEAEARRRAFEGHTVDRRLLDLAGPDVAFLHCLPAHRGEEVSAEVMDDARSLVWQQAANRMHAARGLLGLLFDPA